MIVEAALAAFLEFTVIKILKARGQYLLFLIINLYYYLNKGISLCFMLLYNLVKGGKNMTIKS